MIKAHKIRLHPTPEQANYFARAAGTSRFVWNWALAEWDRQYQAGEKPTTLKLKKQFNEIRRELFPGQAKAVVELCLYLFYYIDWSRLRWPIR